MAVSAGASGVIIGKEGNRYFVLTANHVISELENVDKTKTIIMDYNDLDYKIGEKFIGMEEYYNRFPEIKLEHISIKYDLALISFISYEDYTVLPISKDNIRYGNKVASMSNPYGKRNIVSVGKIGRKKLWHFEDEAGKVEYPIIIHSAVLSVGSSGSALINEDLEIVGINLGGNENLFHQFISGMAIPDNRIRAFLEEWKN